MRTPPAYIEKLSENQIFVFGSNKNGHHLGGAARQAFQEFGATWGKGFGFQGNCFAIPTLDENMNKVELGELQMHIHKFLILASQNLNLEFLVTEIGTGIAGFKHSEVGPMFKGYTENVILPQKFLDEMKQLIKTKIP